MKRRYRRQDACKVGSKEGKKCVKLDKRRRQSTKDACKPGKDEKK